MEKPSRIPFRRTETSMTQPSPAERGSMEVSLMVDKIMVVRVRETPARDLRS
jgi:hypothetical protein